jgi:hydroxylamine reductase
MAYTDHAYRLGFENPQIYADIRQSLRVLGDNHVRNVDGLVAEALKVGELTIRVLEMLSTAHTNTYGNPKPTQVPTYQRPGKAILISGHDLRDLEELLKQTAGKGIDIYTHGEMLPAHGYPGLKEKYPHLFGNFGGAWMLQQMEFPQFKGPIVLTSNCLLEPRKSYKDRVYTMNSVGFPGVKHLSKPNFSSVIEQALSMEGFTKEPAKKTHVMTGFGHAAVLGVADKIVDAVKSGAIKHFFLVGGCDGAEGERSYYRDIAQQAPKDSVVLTLGCGKYRFNNFQEQFGDIGGIPRLLDMGQCNDSYSAVVVALALQKAFGAQSVNDLPLSFAVSWFEQKAVAVLLALLKLNVKRIRLGPKPPAFVTPNMLDLLVKNFDLRLVGNASEDLKNMLQHQ